MSHAPNDPSDPVDPFPAPPQDSPFPPLGREFETLAARDGAPLPAREPAREGSDAAAAAAAAAPAPPIPAPAQPDPVPDAPPGVEAPERRNALIAFGRFAFPPGPAPEDADLAARDQRWASRVVLCAAVLMLVFNAAAIQNWSRQQPPGWTTSTVQQLSDVWSAQLAQLGADRPRRAVNELWTALAALRFPGQDEPEQGSGQAS